MNRHPRERDDDRALVRDALQRAAGKDEPDVARLLEAVPDLMAEARRRRAAAVAIAPTLSDRARQAIPRLAVATAVVVVLATTVTFLDRDATAADSTSFDSLVLTGPENGATDTGDILLDAVTKGEENDG
jgi:hypothetical protein